MKRLTLIAVLFIAGSLAATAQNSLVGKWKLSSFIGEGTNVNLDNPAETKKALAEQLKKETGKDADSAQIEMMYNIVVPMFNSMTFEFTNKGVAYYSMPNEMGLTVADTTAYVADYTKGILTTTSKKDGTEKKESNKFRFEGGFLVIEDTDKGETFKLKKAN
jgi:hypothetical protein